MNELLDEVLTAHGGTQRWQSVSAITARGRLGGLFPTRFPGNKLANFTVAVRIFPTRRRVFPRGPGGRVLSRPTLLALDFDEIEIQR